MLARKCDLCGELYEHYYGRELFKDEEQANAMVLIDSDPSGGNYPRKTLDLCPLCMRDFLDLVEFLKCRGPKESKKQ